MKDIITKLEVSLFETELNSADPKGDYEAKKKALHDLETDPVVMKEPDLAKAVQQRKLDLEKEARSKGIRESTDHEASMAKAELVQIAKNAKILFNSIREGDELPGWVSSYITLANDHLNSAAEHVEYNPPEQK